MNTTLLLNNRYQITETLGRGGFGETFLAIDTHLPSGRKCVIKQLKPIINESNIPQWMYERFEQEARILEHLGEEQIQIPSLYAYFCEDKNFYLVQEWVEGVTLSNKVLKEGNLTPDEVEDILLKLLPVLDYIHQQNIVHRDIKPDNIIFRAKDNLPVLIDFGAVKEALTTFVYSGGHSAYSIAIGTPGYMASEQAAGRPIFSSDLYSLGLTAIFLLTGKSPQNLKTDKRTGEILWRDELPDLHSNLAGVIDKAIRFTPRERFADAQEMLRALQPSIDNGQNTIAFGHNSTKVSIPHSRATISNDKTIAVGGRNINYGKVSEVYRHDSFNSLGNNQTVALNSSPSQGEIDQDKNSWWGSFFPLFWLSLIAIASFAIGYNVIANRLLDSESQVVTQPEENPTPEPDNIQPRRIPRNIIPEIIIPNNNPPADEEGESEVNLDSQIEETENNDSSTSQDQPIEIEITQPPSDSPPPSNTNPLPVITTGSVVNELIGRFGQPNAKESLPADNATRWNYQNVFNSGTDISYKINNNSGKVQEVDLSFPASTDVEVVVATFDRLLKGNMTPIIKEALKQVTDNETDLRSFNSGNWQGFIRKNNNSININVRSTN